MSPPAPPSQQALNLPSLRKRLILALGGAGLLLLLILSLLVKRAPHLVTRQEVLDTVWGDEEPDSDALRSHIYALRNALDKPFPSPMLETLHGQGYRLVKP